MGVKKIFLIFLLAAGLLVSGCTVRLGPASGSADGGVWKSVDVGQNWSQIVSVPLPEGQKASISNVNIRRMVFDPQDHNTIYLATENSGLFYTYNAGKDWRQFNNFTRGKILSVAVDHRDKCVLYLTVANKIYKSTDCGRFWTNIYFHQNSEVVLSDIIVSHENSSIIYAVTGSGDIIKSLNGGNSWATIYRVDRGSFVDVVMDPGDSNIIYAATTREGIYKTEDAGASWQSLGEGLKSYTGSHDYKSLITDPDTAGGLILVTKYGMLRSRNYGESWELMNILPSSKSAIIYAVAVNPSDSNEIYYATRSSLVKTVDGGRTWSSKKLPFSRAVSDILVDPTNPNIIYLGSFIPRN